MTQTAPTYDVEFLEEVQAFIVRQGDAWGKSVRDMLWAEMSVALNDETLREWYAVASA